MKKIAIILAAILAVSAVSCKKETELPEGGPAVFNIAARSKLDVGKLDVGKSATVKLYATTYDTGVREQLTATFAVPENPEQYLEPGAVLLPAGCYEFTVNDVVIDRYNKDSRTGEIAINYPSTLAKGNYSLPVTLANVKGSPKASADPSVVIVIRMTAN